MRQIQFLKNCRCILSFWPLQGNGFNNRNVLIFDEAHNYDDVVSEILSGTLKQEYDEELIGYQEVEDFFVKAGHSVFCARDGEEALKILQNEAKRSFPHYPPNSPAQTLYTDQKDLD